MLTVNYFCVALCKLSSVQRSVQPVHMAIGWNNNAGQCVRAEQSRVFLFILTAEGNNACLSEKACTRGRSGSTCSWHSQPGSFLPRRTTKVSSVSLIQLHVVSGTMYSKKGKPLPQDYSVKFNVRGM